MFYPKKSIHEIVVASTECTSAAEIVYRIEDEWKKRLRIILITTLSLILIIGTVISSISYLVYTQQKNQQETSILTSVKAISKLATVQHHYTDVFEWHDHKDLFLFQLKKSILATGSASVLAGINLEKSEIETEQEGKMIRLILPHAEVFSVDTELRFAGEDDTIFQRISTEDRNQLLNMAKANFRQKALEGEILRQAEEKAMGQITEYLQSLGFKSEIRFQ